MIETNQLINESNEIMTVEDLASFLRISRVKSYELVKQKGFPSIKIGRTIRISRTALLQWLANESNLSA